MDLTTRCPHCGTTFAASLEQLQLRKGYIRCVQCAHIFDGYEAVVPATSAGIDPEPLKPVTSATPPPEKPSTSTIESPPEPSISSAPMPSLVRGRREFTVSDPERADAQDEPTWTVPLGSGAASAPTTPASDHVVINLDRIAVEPDRTRRDPDHVRVDPGPVLTDSEHVQLGPRDRDAAAHYTERWREPAQKAPTAWWQTLIILLWVVVLAAGVVIFVAQLAYVFRVQIAENIPTLRPALERMCTTLDCTVPYSRKIELIVITQSSLQQDPGEGEAGHEEVLLQFTLRNVHDGPQEWPSLVLDLTDFSGALIARKHLSKVDYLPADTRDTPFLANSDRAVALPLTVQGLQVNGYQLTPFYP